jgi:hypothetical protein
MLYAILIYDAESANPSSEPPPPEIQQAVMAEYNAYTTSLRDSGAFQAGDALQPAPTATTLRQSEAGLVTTDGPFAETKEALGGFYVIEARDLDEALAIAARCPGLKYGSAIEVRPVLDYSAVGQAAATAGATA